MLCLEAKESTESAQICQDFGTEGRADKRSDTIDKFIARIDIDAGITIGRHRRVWRRQLRSEFKGLWSDTRPQARNNRRRIRCNTSRIVLG